MVEAQVEAKEQSAAKKIKLDSIDQNDDNGLDEKIKHQLDYYFSDVNIIKDKFLLNEIKKEDGWVKLSVLLTFARLQQLTKDETRLVAALKKCNSDVIELDESKKQIRRKNKVPDTDEYKRELDLRTVHISGFPTDYTFDYLRTFCSQFGEVDSVAMRRHFKTRFFKGCIHVVYKQVEDAKKVLATNPLKSKDRELRSESMEQYHKRKAEMAQKRMENRKKGKTGGDSTNKHSDKTSNEEKEAEKSEIKEDSEEVKEELKEELKEEQSEEVEKDVEETTKDVEEKEKDEVKKDADSQ